MPAGSLEAVWCAVGTVTLLLPFTVIKSDLWRNGGDPFAIDIPPVHALFEMTPTLPFDDQVEAVRWTNSCGSARSAQPPMLMGLGIVDPVSPYRRAPRLCVRVGPDGHVLATRVLRSSGLRESDRMLEQQARALLFTPAYRDGRQVAATVTLDLIGNGGPSTPDTAVEIAPIGPL